MRSEPTALVLGGALSPIGNGINIVDAPIGDVIDAVTTIRDRCNVTEFDDLRAGAQSLDPLQAPWTVELLVDCGDRTAYLNNGFDGGDITAVAPAVARQLGVRCLTAQHSPRYGPGHASTQLWIEGPDGEPPLGHVRTLAAHCQDGRWTWHENGEVQPFEQLHRYAARRVRDRLDRKLLIEYLAALDIRPDDPSFFGRAISIRQIVAWSSRSQSVADWLAENRPDVPGGGSVG